MNTKLDITLNTHDKIAELARQIEELRKRLDEIKENNKTWNPKGGGWHLDSGGCVFGPAISMSSCVDAGSEYPTKEAAESALPYVTFYKRLCCLAQELNPSGRVGGGFCVLPMDGASKWIAHPCEYSPTDCLFESKFAAEKAAQIMNRDKWTIPGRG